MKLREIGLTPPIVAISVMLLALTGAAAPKIVYVAPGGTGDGTSWENATASIADAYASAAAFAEGWFDSGEVWIKTGRYTIASQIDIHSHVTVRGGFAGGETDPSQADAKKNLTILSGDKGDDAYWRPNELEPASPADRIFIWSGEDKMTYNPPNPDRKDARWIPYRGASGHDNEYCFVGSDPLMEECRFYGITFSCFRRSAVKVGAWIPKVGSVAAHSDESKFGRGIVISNCFFVAHATSVGDTTNNGAVQLFNAEAELSDCTFDGCWTVMTIRTGETPVTNVIRRCTFSNGSSSQVSLYDGNAFNGWIVEDCDFYRNYAGSGGGVVLYFDQASNCSDVYCRVANCKIRENWISGTASSLFAAAGSYGGAWHQFVNCDFHANIASNTSVSAVSACFACGATTRRWYFRGCSFRENAVKDYPGYYSVDAKGNVTQGRVGSIFITGTANNYAHFVDCSIVSNSVEVAESEFALENTLDAGTITLYNPNTRLFMVGSAVKDSIISGGKDGIRAEFRLAGPGSNGALTIANTILYNESVGYVPLYLNEALVPYLHNCYISGFDEATAGCTKFGRCEGIATTGDPGFAEFKKGPFANWAIGLAWNSAYAKAASDVKIADFDVSQVAGDRILALEYTPGFVRNNPWKALFYGYSTAINDAAAAAYGITAETPLATDAFGQPRKAGKVSLGPLAYDAPGLMLLLR